MLQRFLIIIGIVLAIIVAIFTFIIVKKSKEETDKKLKICVKNIFIIVACLGLCAAGLIIQIWSVKVNINGNNNTVIINNETAVNKDKKKKEVPPQESDFTSVDLLVRNLAIDLEKNSWYGTVVANEGDVLEFKATYKNESDDIQRDVQVLLIESDYLEYVPGTTILYNGNNKEGTKILNDGIVDKGINIGDYNSGAAGTVIFRAKVKEGLTSGTNVLRDWVQIYVNDLNPELVQDCVQDFADVMVLKNDSTE